ncbi:MAG: hypothetical protein N2C14_16730 [Planctomycetales bacterium]
MIHDGNDGLESEAPAWPIKAIFRGAGVMDPEFLRRRGDQMIDRFPSPS